MQDGTTRGGILRSTCERLVCELDATACVISRAVGDVLVHVAEDPGPLPTLQLGRGYLVSDFPLTRRVLDAREAVTVVLGDGEDAAEESVLEELGLASLLMLPFVVKGERWGLVEVYRREPRRFATDELDRAAALVADAAARFALLVRPA